MKSLQLDRKSLHYHLAVEYGDMSEFYPCNNICSYLKRVFRGIFFVVVFITIGGVLASLLWADLLGWLIASLQTHTVLNLSPRGLGAIVSNMGIIALFGIKYILDRMNYVRTTRKKKLPTFLSEAYRSFKEKSCIPINFNDLEVEEDS